MRNHVKHTICPFCGYKHNRASIPVSQADDSAPVDGDVTLCIKCGEFGEFKGHSIVKITRVLSEDTKKQMNDIRVAWLRMRATEGLKTKSL